MSLHYLFPVQPLHKEAILAAALVTNPPAMLVACCVLVTFCCDIWLGPGTESGHDTWGT